MIAAAFPATQCVPGRWRYARLAAIVAAVGVLLGACGDGRLSKNEYIKQSNAIQQDASATMNKLGSVGGKQAEAKALVVEFDKVIKRTEALKPPTAWQEHHDAILASMKTLRDSIKVMAQARKGDVKTATAQYARITEAQTGYEKAINAINADR